MINGRAAVDWHRTERGSATLTGAPGWSRGRVVKRGPGALQLHPSRTSPTSGEQTAAGGPSDLVNRTLVAGDAISCLTTQVGHA